MKLIELAEHVGLKPKWVAATKGGEYKSPCPSCEGADRFIIWPKINRYWRRRCLICGDAIQFCRDFLKMSYVEACCYLQRDPQIRRHIGVKVNRNELKTAALPPNVWRIKAASFVHWCHADLMQRQDILDYLKNRGFREETIAKHQFGYCYNPSSNNGDFYRSRSESGLPDRENGKGGLAKLWLPAGIVIPYHDIAQEVLKIKIRRVNWHVANELPKYIEVSGSSKK